MLLLSTYVDSSHFCGYCSEDARDTREPQIFIDNLKLKEGKVAVCRATRHAWNQLPLNV